MKTHRQPAKRSGFTLMELMVAMAITTIIVTVLVSITSIALETWNRSRSELRASRQAKGMTDILARDFEGLVLRRNGLNEWLSARSADLQGSKSLKSANAAELDFLTAATDRYDGNIGIPTKDLGGDVSSVGYRLAYKDPLESGKAGSDTFVLYRKLANPDETFNKIIGPDIQAAFDSVYKTADITKSENFVCENILQFSVTFNVEVQDKTSTPPKTYIVPVIVDASSSSANQVKELSITGSGVVITSQASSFSVGSKSFSLAEVQAGRVVSVQVALTVVSDFGIDQINKREFKSPEAKEKFLAQNSYQYTKLVQLPSM
ncbi:prepilin-type N-terminal cleavage/methylation domain-containing protein [bacterium]|nr:prepilin-type N-terminal cleavage/methylation domain-containing protein [bacterium]